MIKIKTRMVLLGKVLLAFLVTASTCFATVKGIYLTQYSAENTAFLTSVIKNAKAAGVNTFVIDMDRPSKKFTENIALVRDSGIQYVARVVMFPDGGTPEQINNPDYWQKRYTLVKEAADLGASSIQLDYIRFKASQKSSPENSQKIHNIIKWYKNKLAAQNIKLQVDIFGIASFGESTHIGQSVKLFSQTVDAICPMVYPSHYTPFAYHYKHPYETILGSLESIQKQFPDKMPMKLIPYIELSNYHFKMSHDQTQKYINAQIDAVEEADADGWYAWSPHNRYDNLFLALNSRKAGGDKVDHTTPLADPQSSADNKVKPADATKGDKANKTASAAAKTSTTAENNAKSTTLETASLPSSKELADENAKPKVVSHSWF